MAKGNITKTAVDRLVEGWIWDTGVNGFGVRRQTNGAFYYLRYRVAGRQRMQSIGRHGSPWTPDTARREALRLLGLVATGTDPGRATHGEAFSTVTERYLAKRESAMKPRAYAEVVRHLRVHSAPLHSQSLADISRRSVAELLGRIETGSGLVTRNRVRSSMSAFFAWCIAEGLTELNPVTGTAVADEGSSRSRVLTDAELALIWRSLATDRYSDIVRLLLLTGQRREEVGGLKWSEVVSGVDGTTLLPVPAICLPPERVKNSQEHTIPLSPQVMAIISRQPREGEFVFGPFTGWSNAKATLDARIAGAAVKGSSGPGVAEWRLHDLRRTMATRLGGLGVLPHVVECILNHLGGFRSGVAGIYNRNRYEGEMRSALCAWADYVTGADGWGSASASRSG